MKAVGDTPTVVAVEDLHVLTRGLPLAEARNRGADIAMSRGADLLVFLDVDCIPSPALVATYAAAEAHVAAETTTPSLLCGPVTYLPSLLPGCCDYPDDLTGLTRPHPARPSPAPGQVLMADDLCLFWSLSFAMSSNDWVEVGGFDESYSGYGAEDTDLAQKVGASGGKMFWVGGAHAYHQWHPVSEPPIEHLDAILRNANVFQQKWGWTPMQGWLIAFEELGLAHRDPVRSSWVSSN